MMERVPVSSSNISSIGYDDESQTMEVEFGNGGVYQYEGVSSSVYRSCIAAPSVGKYFHENIKARYATVKVE